MTSLFKKLLNKSKNNQQQVQQETGFPKDPCEVLEEVRRILAMSQDELNLFLKTLKKSLGFDIAFEFGSTRILFVKPEFLDCTELLIKTETGNLTTIVRYNIDENGVLKPAHVENYDI